MSEETQDCPKCGDGCLRDSVDIGVGMMHGPWGCPSCGWSSDSDYDRSEGAPPADSMRPGWYSDQWGNLHSKARLAEDLQQFGERFGLDLSDVISEFESEEP